ncbi:MAG TPA: hypothetical protein PLC98_15830 [Anaerolineales bacterium]|nr:hypothetical protein [Anaerolineales bacterium]
MRASRARLMHAKCKILRLAASVNGKATGLSVHLTDVPCTPLMPISQETAVRNGIEAPSGKSVLYVEGSTDVRTGDVAEIDDKELPVVAASRLPDRRGGDMLELVVQVVRTERY